MTVVIDPAGKDIVVHCTAPPIEPGQQAGASVCAQFELNRPTGFLLHDNRTRSNLTATDKIADLHLNQIATPKFAVDRKVKERAISQAAALIEVEADFPDLFWFERALRAYGPSSTPDSALDGSGFVFRHLHDRSPMARVAIRGTIGRSTSRTHADQTYAVQRQTHNGG